MRAISNRNASPRTSHPAKGIEIAAQSTDVIRRMFGISRSNEVVHTFMGTTALCFHSDSIICLSVVEDLAMVVIVRGQE